MDCPSCDREIPFQKVLFAVNPIFIRCPHCHARLRGNATMMGIGAVVVLVALALAVPGILWLHQTLDGPRRWIASGAFIVLLSAAIGVPMTRFTMRMGRYRLREPKRD